MSIPPKDGKLIYHLTSTDNFESILRNGLRPRKDLVDFSDVADQDIISHRVKFGLDSYVPFHFFASNPFDGAVQMGNPNKRFLFITVSRTYAQSNDFSILTRHPLSNDCSELLSYEEGHEAIDWDKMAERNYSDNECKEICMAECLSPLLINPNDFFCIYVPEIDTYNKMKELRNTIVGPDAFKIALQPYFFKK